MIIIKEKPDPPFCIVIDSYMHPNAVKTKSKLQIFATPSVQNFTKEEQKDEIKEDNSIVESNPRRNNKWQEIVRKLRVTNMQNKLNLLRQRTFEKTQTKQDNKGNTNEYSKKVYKMYEKLKESSIKYIRVPQFLRARKDDGLCKRKTGFEIYCEIAQIHGFINFVGAKTWQRIFWCSVIFIAMVMSAIVLAMSHLMNIDTPTIVYIESPSPISTVPFPAVTICKFNGISTDSHHSSIDCGFEMLRCKWKGKIRNCGELFQQLDTPFGRCCTFNYYGFQNENTHGKFLLPKIFYDQPEYTNTCGYKTGLTLLIDPGLSDVLNETINIPMYQLLIHDAYDYPTIAAEAHILISNTVITIGVTPQKTYGADYLSSLEIQKRRCYLPEERQIYGFTKYTFSNCLFVCQTEMLLKKCGCVPRYLMRVFNGTVCKNEKENSCVVDKRDLFAQQLAQQSLEKNRSSLTYRDEFICNCYPQCDFHQYKGILDSASMNTKFLLGHKQFFKDIKLNGHILLHIFFETLQSEKLRRDVYENWLTYVGTFGGITGLYMGYSFVSGFEMIFFVFVRPACNWINKQQIRYRVRRRQRQMAQAKN